MNPKHLKTFVRWTIGVLCLGYIAYFFWQRKDQVELAFSLSPMSILLLFLLSLTYNLVQSYRYQFVLEKCSGVALSFGTWFQIFILGIFLNTFIPQMGNIYRSIHLKKTYGISYTNYISAYISFAWMDTSVNLVIAVIIVLVTDPHLQISGMNAALLLAGISGAVIAAPVVSLKGCQLFQSKIRRLVWIQSKLAEVFAATMTNLRDLSYVLKVLAFSLIGFVQMYVTFYVGFRCFNLYLTLPTMALFYAIFNISIYLIITPGNLGIRELAYGILSEQMHLGMAEGILISAVFRIFHYIIYFALAVPMGGWGLLRHGKEYRLAEHQADDDQGDHASS